MKYLSRLLFVFFVGINAPYAFEIHAMLKNIPNDPYVLFSTL
jgi:hypothetical protein